jgi:hypothetical protein
MTKFSQLAIVVGLAVLVAVAALSVRSAQAQDVPDLALQATATPATSSDSVTAPEGSTAPGAQEPSMVELWDQVCVRKIPYTILAIPENATFEVVQPEGPLPTPEPGSSNRNELACSNPVTFGGKQVVVCTGPQLFSFDLRVTNGGTSEDFSVPLKFCPIKSPENYKPGEATEEP